MECESDINIIKTMSISNNAWKKMKLLLVYVMVGIFANAEIGYAGPVEDLVALLPEDTEHFVLEDLELEEQDLFLTATYIYKPEGAEVYKYVGYGATEKVSDKAHLDEEMVNIAYGVNYEPLRSTDVNINNIMSYFGDELYNETGYLQWQLEHSTLAEDSPEMQLFPLEENGYRMIFYRWTGPKQINARYEHDNFDVEPRITLKQGERARQYARYMDCRTQDQKVLDLGGADFRVEHDDRRSTVRNFGDDLYIKLSQGFDEEDEAAYREEQLEQFSALFNFDEIQSRKYRNIDEPGDGIAFQKLREDDFREHFPEQTGDFRLQELHSYEDAMHLRATYVYEPEDYEVRTHLTYGDYSFRLDSGRSSRPANRFNAGEELGCLSERLDMEIQAIIEIIDDLPQLDEATLTRWEMKNIDLTVLNPWTEHIPVDHGDYTIRSLDLDDEAYHLIAEYDHPEQPVTLSVRYGDEAAEQYNRYRLLGHEEDHYPFEVGGASFDGIQAGNHFLAYSWQDFLLIEAGMDDPEDPEDTDAHVANLQDFISGIDVSTLMAWEPSDDYEMVFDGTLDDGAIHCLEPECLDEHLPECEPAGFGGIVARRLGVEYRIEEADGDRCRMSMTFLANPNRDLVDEPLYFYIDRDGSFTTEGQSLIDECMEGESDDCHGPIFDAMEN